MKTQSRFGVTIPKQLIDTPYGAAYAETVTVLGADPVTKVDFTTFGVGDNNYLSVSPVDNHFIGVTLGNDIVWRIDYSGWAQFVAGPDEELTFDVYVNNVAIPQLRQTIKAVNGEYLPFAKSWILFNSGIRTGQTVDLRVVSNNNDIILNNVSFLLQQVSVGIKSLYE